MVANLKRGVRRIAIAIAIPWILLWGAAWYFWHQRVLWQESTQGMTAGQPTTVWFARLSHYQNWQDLCFLMAFVVPILIAVLTGLVRWVRRGFRQSS